ncbi:hypothetical protein Cch01nite_22200 [Cellulomonas chitinilytica]|uniref:Prolipoprotein diacylglyceryl transferase n=1 Tax=Cellulomonas chitinilytica TaxID=398759 RepID=A0A919P4J6_9CELL|nr:prolipoprotein diacylglyceryl transferase family protein [Cellulomonas chitinilytica]GIG21496.1 hypothetical protein Cch01nite_22200 [Cellulomonas chitinilytica]
MPGPDIHVGRTTVPAYRVLALGGLVLGVATALTCAGRSGTPPAAVLVMALAGALGSVAVMVVRAARGSADWVWHEHEAVVLVAALVVGIGFGGPLGLLDAAQTGLLVVLGVGRVGCLVAGCCYGRPVAGSRPGVCYGPGHARAGFPAALVGTRLAPVQAAEAAGALVLATLALASLALATLPVGTLPVAILPVATLPLATGTAPGHGLPAGAVLVAALGSRACLRLVVETWRGDHPTPALWLSVPQWWCVGTAILVLLLSSAGALPVGAWTVAPAAVVVLAPLAAVASHRTRAEASG